MKNSKLDMMNTMLLILVSFVMTYAINFVLTSYLTNNIGIELTGYVNLAKNFVSYAIIITTAVNSFAVRYITLAYNRGDIEYMNKCYSSVFYADLIIGGIILIVSVGMNIFIESIIKVSPELVSSVRWLFSLMFLSFFFSTCGTVFTSAPYIKNKLGRFYFIKILSHLVEVVVLVYMFTHYTPEVWYVGLALVATTLFALAGNIWLTNRLVPEAQIRRRFYSGEVVKEIVGNGVWNSINSLGNTLNSGLDLYVSNRMLGEIAMGQISIAKTIGAVTSTMNQMVALPFHPRFLKKYSEGDKSGLIYDMKQSMKLSGMINNIVCAGFAVLGVSFYHLWIPTQDIQLIYLLTLITLSTSVSESVLYPLYYIYILTMKNRFPSAVTIIGGLFNVASMILLIHFTHLGIYAIVLTTAVIMNVINLIINPLYMCHCLEVRKTTFYPEILKHVLSLVVCLFFFVICSKALPGVTSWIRLVVLIPLYVLIGIVIQLPIVYNRNEITSLFKDFLGIIKRGNA